MNAYLLSHNGLGDNITMISAVRFLRQYYKKVFFLCKNLYVENVKLFFDDDLVVIIPFNQNDEFNQCESIINSVVNDDLFICGFHKSYLKSRITNPRLLEYQNNYDDDITYDFIKSFYQDIGLDLSIYYNYFDISSCKISENLYNNVKKYKISFFHTQASNRQINLESIVLPFAQNSNYIVICANKNFYNEQDDKYDIANEYVNQKVAHYIDIIKNAEVIHVIDSCFSCIVYPLQYRNKLIAKECVIHTR